MSKSHPDFIFAPFEILSDDRLTLRQIRVLLAILSWRLKNTNLSRVSRETLADLTGYDVNRVSNITTQLVKLKWIEKIGNGGKSQWSEYQICDISKVLNGDQNGKGLDASNGDRIGKQTVTESVSQTVTESARGIDTVTNTVTITDKKIYKKIPPKIEWIIDYVQQQHIDIDPQHFFDVYQSRGWMVGKQKMKDWQAAIRTFARNQKNWSKDHATGKQSGESKSAQFWNHTKNRIRSTT